MSVYYGKKLNIEISGSSHDERIYGRIDGLPAGEPIDEIALRDFMSRRAAGRYVGSTARHEKDVPVIISGVSCGKTDGSPLSVYIENSNVRRTDYDTLRCVPRPGHADLGAYFKFGAGFDMSGGGPFSGRMTAPLCAIGGIALGILRRRGIRVSAHIRSIGDVEDERFGTFIDPDISADIYQNLLPTISPSAAEKMSELITQAERNGDSVGGIIECAVTGISRGMGGELFDGIEGRLSALLFAIPAVKGVEFGAGFEASRLRGSQNNDEIAVRNGELITLTNNCGGILGGISTGMPLVFSVAVKPTPSISIPQRTVNITTMTETEISVKGRHDACIVPRTVSVVEAVTALAVLDMECDNDG